MIQHYFSQDSHLDSLVLNTGIANVELRYPLNVWYDNNDLVAGRCQNRAILRLCGLSKPEKPWCGVVIVLRFSGKRCRAFKDVTLSDLSTISAYFSGHR